MRVARGVAHPAGARGRAAAAAVVPRIGQRVCVEVVLRRVRKRHIVPIPRTRARHAVCNEFVDANFTTQFRRSDDVILHPNQ